MTIEYLEQTEQTEKFEITVFPSLSIRLSVLTDFLVQKRIGFYQEFGRLGGNRHTLNDFLNLKGRKVPYLFNIKFHLKFHGNMKRDLVLLFLLHKTCKKEYREEDRRPLSVDFIHTLVQKMIKSKSMITKCPSEKLAECRGLILL